MKNKKELLREAIDKFKKSDKSSSEYMNLFSVVSAVTRQGSGLVWSDVKNILDEYDNEKIIDDEFNKYYNSKYDDGFVVFKPKEFARSAFREGFIRSTGNHIEKDSVYPITTVKWLKRENGFDFYKITKRYSDGKIITLWNILPKHFQKPETGYVDKEYIEKVKKQKF